MTRVSLKEAYDNKDVVAQIYAIRDTAESAVDTSEQAVTTANTASEHVDALVPQVEGAVENANSASASAQASAQTVAGYENRLATVEDATEDLAGDLNAVTLRVTTAEGDIVTIQGRVTALETADGQNVKINRVNDYAVGLTGNQNNIGGIKGFVDGVSAYPNDWKPTYASAGSVGDIKLFAKLKNPGVGKFIALELTQVSNTAPCYGMLILHNTPNYTFGWASRVGFGSNNPLQNDTIVVVGDGTDYYIGSRKKAPYGDLRARVKYSNNYYTMDTNPSPQIEWLNAEINIGTGTGYTVIEVSQ